MKSYTKLDVRYTPADLTGTGDGSDHRALSVPCPVCKASIREECKVELSSGIPIRFSKDQVHVDRFQLYKKLKK